jgi:hypothetical protein
LVTQQEWAIAAAGSPQFAGKNLRIHTGANTSTVLHSVLATACRSARAIRHKQLRIRRVNFHERKWVRFGER